MLENLKPDKVWKYFEKYCSIPHPSGYETKGAEFIVNTAAKLGLPALKDSAGNVLVRKKGRGEKEGSPTVVLQCHLDMVAQKNSSTKHDFFNDPIQTVIEGEWVKAKGTTLGADNGIGVALTCAILEADNIVHPPIEALFTIDEERGMTGAFGLQEGFLNGKRMINLDTENEDEICIGCAGGMDITATLPVGFEPSPKDRKSFNAAIKGLRGGHSGIDIHMGRGNAIRLMAELLENTIDKFDLRISNIYGGSARNAIPRETFATLTVPEKAIKRFIVTVSEIEKKLKTDFSSADPDVRIELSEASFPERVINRQNCRNFISVISMCPNGVIRMSETVRGTVETSNNIAIVNTDQNLLIIECMLRSSSERQLDALRDRINDLFLNNGFKITQGGRYPAWQPVASSALLSIMKEAYLSVYRKEPVITAVHAGLECGIIGARFPKMDMISCGPTISFAHSPDERIHIPSVERFWNFIVAGLERL